MKFNPPVNAPTAEKYHDGELGVYDGDVVPASAINDTQWEIVHAILAANIVPDKNDDTQLAEAISRIATRNAQKVIDKDLLKITVIENTINNDLKPRVIAIENTINNELRPDISGLKQRVTTVETQIKDDILPRIVAIENTINNELKPNISNLKFIIDDELRPKIVALELRATDLEKRATNLESRCTNIENTINNELRPDISGLKQRVTALENKDAYQTSGDKTKTKFTIAGGKDLADFFLQNDDVTLNYAGSGNFIKNISLNNSTEGKAAFTATRGGPEYCSHCTHCECCNSWCGNYCTPFCSHCTYCTHCSGFCTHCSGFCTYCECESRWCNCSSSGSGSSGECGRLNN